MKAFILDAPRKLRAVDIPVPEPAPHEVRVRIAYCGICGSDVEVYLGHRRIEALSDPPMLGHEPCGVVDKVGEHVGGLQTGDRVATLGPWGALAEYLVCPPEKVMKLPPEIPLIDAAAVEVLPGIVMAATRMGITAAHNVLVLGQGVSGLLLTRFVALNGCRRLIAVDLFGEKLEIAREFGATHTINASSEDVAARVDEIVPGGVDYTIMATLDGNDVPRALEWTRFKGKIILYGSIGPCDGFDFFRVHEKAVTIVKEFNEQHSVIETRRLWREAVQLIADGLVNVRRLRTHIFPLEKVAEAMELRSTPRPDVIHVVIENDWARKQRLAGGP